MLRTFKRVLLYGGLEKNVYDKYSDYVLRQDMKNLRIYMLVTGFGFLAVALVSLFINIISVANTKLYMAMAIAMGVLLMWQRFLMQQRNTDTLRELLIYLFMGVVYTEGIILTLQHPDKLAVTFIATMLMLPLLFARRPLPMAVFNAAFALIFCVYVSVYKQPDVASTDIWNGVTFLGVSIAGIVVVVPIRIKSIAQTQIIREMSEYDMLTGLKNRNSYEGRCIDLEREPQSITVVYADANGLHELNNTRGHGAGDDMLRTVASTLRDSFEGEHAYRIGGDEFVVLVPGAKLDEVRERVRLSSDEIERHGHSVSFGCAVSENDSEDISRVIKRAESEMYTAKGEYYKCIGGQMR